MQIIDLTYFVGQIAIGQRSQLSVQEDLQRAIAKRQAELLTNVFGVKMYKAFINGIDQDPIPAIWDRILNGCHFDNDTAYWAGLKNDGKQSIIANYTYCHYMRDTFSIATGSGYALPKNENAIHAYPAYKEVAVWNEMVNWICVLKELIRYYRDDYPDYRPLVNYTKMNRLGL